MDDKRTLKELRAKQNWTQKQAAKAYGISTNHYQRIEKDPNALNKSSIALIVKIAKIQDIRVGDIYLPEDTN